MKSSVARTKPQRDSDLRSDAGAAARLPDESQAGVGIGLHAARRQRALAASRAPAAGKAVKTVKVPASKKAASAKVAKTAKAPKEVKIGKTVVAKGAKPNRSAKSGSAAVGAVKAAQPAKTGSGKPAPGKKPAPAAATRPKAVSPAAGHTSRADSKPGPAKTARTPVARQSRRADNWKKKRLEQLVDDDVLAMPDSEYMNETQLAFFRLKLAQLRDSILAMADKTTARLRKDTVVVPDPADRATIEEEHALELRTRDRERKLLKKIEQSIARIDAGDYGYCDETGEPIGVARLLARPTATLSLEAQQRREHRQKMFGD